GLLGDKIGARRLVTAGMLISAAACGAFGSASTGLWFGAFFLINGLAQATGWPGTTRAMAEWTTLKNRGTVMAFWATCYQVGGIVAAWFCGYLLGRFGWRSAFYGPALCMALVALLVFALLRPGPSLSGAEVELAADDVEPDPSLVRTQRIAAQRAVWKSGLLWSYGASYFFIKYIRYALLFWLPYYLSTELAYDGPKAAYVSSAFEVGGIVGVIFIGTLSDRVRRWSRPALSGFALLGLAAALLLYTQVSHSGTVANAIALALVGAMLFAPDSLLSGAAAQDAGGPLAAATATGMVNGIGSLGQLVETLLVPALSKHFGWRVLFPTLVMFAGFSVLALVPALLARRSPPPQDISQPS
ncbi:MAG TPA: MFS transporter, partial [Polyangiaceae bacterium]|nr:MFS transporter [Polyangiaceae bacterium]